MSCQLVSQQSKEDFPLKPFNTATDVTLKFSSLIVYSMQL
uniref:Uncharacterized protein n=1 Tax=Rhizophora mucronata TaxID=61149 RepID=A0A2P2J161_RHIMU